MVRSSKRPFSRWMVSRSVRVWVGWLWPPSPALMMGTSALLGVAHGDDVAVTADGADGVGHALALGGGGAVGGGEAQHLSAQTQHGALEAETGAGGGLEEQGGQNFAVALVGIGGGMVDDVAGGVHQLHDLLRGQLQNVNEMVHTVHSPFLIQFSSEGSSRKASSRATSPCVMYPCWTPT